MSGVNDRKPGPNFWNACPKSPRPAGVGSGLICDQRGAMNMWRREIYRQNVPEGLHDRSLARSAWDSEPQTTRAVGYGVIGAGVRTDLMTGST